MEALKKAIVERGWVQPPDIIRVDSFLNHQLDVELLDAIGREFQRRFQSASVTRILTCEASGIAVAVAAARYFKVPVVFAKRTAAQNLDSDCHTASVYSYTRQARYELRVGSAYLHAHDRVLLLDDFLARGSALLGMMQLVQKAQAIVAGCGVVIEKGFQPGGRWVRDTGVCLESLAVIERIEGLQMIFAD